MFYKFHIFSLIFTSFYLNPEVLFENHAREKVSSIKIIVNCLRKDVYPFPSDVNRKAANVPTVVLIETKKYNK